LFAQTEAIQRVALYVACRSGKPVERLEDCSDRTRHDLLTLQTRQVCLRVVQFDVPEFDVPFSKVMAPFDETSLVPALRLDRFPIEPRRYQLVISQSLVILVAEKVKNRM